jgi:hypothetical protein
VLAPAIAMIDDDVFVVLQFWSTPFCDGFDDFFESLPPALCAYDQYL